jgi:hypothetical protein
VSFAAAYEDAPRVWGVGRVVVDGEVTPWPVAASDIDDEAESQAARLASLGLSAGDLLLIVSRLSEAIHVVPLEKAAGLVGALYSSADATPSDAFRTASLIRQLEPAAVVGLNGAVLEGVADLGRDPADVFGGVPAIATVDDTARAALTAVGLEPRRWVKLGPTSAWEEAPGTLTYDAGRWEAQHDGGEIVVTNLAPRLTAAKRLRTGLHGRVAAPGTIVLA